MGEHERTEGEDGRPTGESPHSPDKVSPWEWVAAAFGTALVLGAIGIMGYEAFGAPETPPTFRMQVDTVLETGGGYLVEFRAHNTGQTTAAGLLVEGELLSDTGSVEKSEVTIDYVPPEASRSAGLYFSEDPRRHRLEIRPKGYDLP